MLRGCAACAGLGTRCAGSHPLSPGRVRRQPALHSPRQQQLLVAAERARVLRRGSLVLHREAHLTAAAATRPRAPVPPPLPSQPRAAPARMPPQLAAAAGRRRRRQGAADPAAARPPGRRSAGSTSLTIAAAWSLGSALTACLLIGLLLASTATASTASQQGGPTAANDTKPHARERRGHGKHANESRSHDTNTTHVHIRRLAEAEGGGSRCCQALAGVWDAGNRTVPLILIGARGPGRPPPGSQPPVSAPLRAQQPRASTWRRRHARRAGDGQGRAARRRLGVHVQVARAQPRGHGRERGPE